MIGEKTKPARPHVYYHAECQRLDQGHEVVLERRCWGGSLILQIIHDTIYDVWWLNVHRVGSATDHDLWGLFTDYQDAVTKFNMVQL